MDRNDVLYEFTNVCINLNGLEDELTRITVETFILNPKIGELTDKIKQLRKRKEQLEEILNKEATNGE